MKNKKRILVLAGLCAAAFCTLNVQASNPQQTYINVGTEDNHIPNGAEQIKLRGKLNFNAGPDDIEAGATENAVYLYFNRNHGCVNISIYNAEGVICYSTVVNTGVQQMVVIPILGNSTGIYSVVLDNAEGLVEGDFEHD
ncbi:MAG: DUF3244 domain-containing protein [Bacteroidales bacterium]|nr:DUF3244 domain-containing protein [Bacteroidales bacterium]